MTESLGEKRFGIVDGNQRGAMSGLEFVQGLVNGRLPMNSTAETLGACTSMNRTTRADHGQNSALPYSG